MLARLWCRTRVLTLTLVDCEAFTPAFSKSAGPSTITRGVKLASVKMKTTYALHVLWISSSPKTCRHCRLACGLFLRTRRRVAC